MSVLTPAAWLEILEDCRARFPNEACGFVLADARDVQLVKPAANIADACHAKNPVRFPRPATEAFIMDPRDLIRVEQMRRLGWRVHVIYHAHTEREGAKFSDDDRAGALLGRPAPTHPDALHVVVALDRFGPSEATAWRWDAGRERFTCAAAATFSRATGDVLHQDPGHELIAAEVPA